jgi:ArsR family transcriptional regulator
VPLAVERLAETPATGIEGGTVDRTLIEEVNLLHAQMCQSLADPTRILMLYSLAEEPRYVTELAELLGVSQPTVSRHLKILRDRGLVHGTRVGNTVHYELRDRRVIEALDLLRDAMAEMLNQQAELAEAVGQ